MGLLEVRSESALLGSLYILLRKVDPAVLLPPVSPVPFIFHIEYYTLFFYLGLGIGPKCGVNPSMMFFIPYAENKSS